MRFFDFLFPPRVDEALIRGVSVDDFLALVAPRLVPDTRPGSVVLLAYHNPLVRAVVHEAKYHGNSHAFKLLGAVLDDYFREHKDLVEHRNSIIVTIPLGKERFKERGYNQVDEIIRRAVKTLGPHSGVSVDNAILTRTRETPSQVSLPREKREENMRGAFGAAHPLDPSYTYI